MKCGDVLVKEPFAGLETVAGNGQMLSVMCWKKQIKLFLREKLSEPVFSFTVPSMKPDDGVLLLKAIFQLFPTSGTNVIESLLKAFLYKCREQIIIENTKRPRNPSQNLLYKITCYINENLRMPLSCGSLAQHFKISENYISQLFIRYAGQSFKNYVQTERLQLACFVLRNSDMNISEIADYCGFNYANYFIRVFKKHYNCTPLEYRMRNI
jgi:AraC-like DNA-binding protein